MPDLDLLGPGDRGRFDAIHVSLKFESQQAMKKIVKGSRKYFGSLVRGIRQRSRRSKYAEWRDEQLSAPPLVSLLRHGTGRNLVLGAAMGYDLAVLQPFIRSLRRFSDCRAMLIVDNETVARQLAEAGVDSLIAVPGIEHAPHVNFSRNALINRTLMGLEGQVDWVFLLDTRDVVFQADPFAALPEADIAFFEEKKGCTFGAAKRNRSWLVNTLGEKWLPLLEHQDVLCGGTILGKREAAASLCKLKLIVGAMIPDGRHAKTGVDQITTNIIARLGLIPRSTVIPYDHQVATLSKANLDFLVPTADDLFLNQVGRLPAIIHQYDKVPEIQATIRQRYALALPT
jgi:hypothetical protein